MDSGERGMNPVAMTIINPWKEYWPSRGSNQRPPVIKSATLPTELWGSAVIGLESWVYLVRKRLHKKIPNRLTVHYEGPSGAVT